MSQAATIDVNVDMGESFARWQLGDDEGMMPFISSANVACGYHAGDPGTIRRTVRAAVEHGLQVGAHVALPDLLGFGRRRMAVAPHDVRDYVLYQIGALKAFVEAEGGTLGHVKPHGALYAMCSADSELAGAVAQATAEIDRDAAAAAAQRRGCVRRARARCSTGNRSVPGSRLQPGRESRDRGSEAGLGPGASRGARVAGRAGGTDRRTRWERACGRGAERLSSWRRAERGSGGTNREAAPRRGGGAGCRCSRSWKAGRRRGQGRDEHGGLSDPRACGSARGTPGDHLSPGGRPVRAGRVRRDGSST